MTLPQLRAQIDEIDREMIALFCRRMELAAEVARYKSENNLPIYVPAREQEILSQITNLTNPSFSEETRQLYIKPFELSRNYQKKCSEIRM